MIFSQKQSGWVGVLFGLFVAVNLVYLGTVPGLTGDEGSEGENVYELQQAGKLVLVGERSYIGPMIDYIRVPFVRVFGYTALALRLVMFVVSVALFWLAVVLSKKVGDETGGLFAMTAGLFSPIYILYQRLGWAITLIPLLVVLTIVLASSQRRFKWWWVGLTIGVGLSSHIMFAASAGGIGAGLMVIGMVKITKGLFSWRKVAGGLWLAMFGMVVGFGSQAIVLLNMTEDQGDPAQVASLAVERWQALPQLLPMIVSGSSYMASYTGAELTHNTSLMITGVILILAIGGWLLNWRRPIMWAWVVGTVAQLVVLMVMIDRFTLRYFVPLALSLWVMGGWGAWSIGRRWLGYKKWLKGVSTIMALGLAGWMIVVVGQPYVESGGSGNDFSIGNRNNKAIDKVETAGLIKCVNGLGRVYAENIHIRNRLIYLSRGLLGLMVVNEANKAQAQWLVEYRSEGVKGCDDKNLPGDCQQLKFFCIKENK